MSRCDGPACTHHSNNDVAGPANELDRSRAEIEDRRDPVVKFDGRGEPVRLSQLSGNRATRRLARKQLKNGGAR